MATCFALTRDLPCYACGSQVRQLLMIRVPEGSTHWEWEFVNNRPVTHFQDSGLRRVAQERFPQLENYWGEFNARCSDCGSNNYPRYILRDLRKAMEFAYHRQQWNDPIGPIEYEASDVSRHLSQGRELSHLRRSNLEQSNGEAIFLRRLSNALHRDMIVAPQVNLDSLTVSMESLLGDARDSSVRFRGFSDQQWEDFSRYYDGYVWRQSIDAVVCMVYAGEIRPVLAIEIDGYGGYIDSELNYSRVDCDEERAWNMENKLELMRLIGMECLVLPSGIYSPNSDGVEVLTPESGIVEIDPLTELVSSVLLDYSNETLSLPLESSGSIALTVERFWQEEPDQEAQGRLRQSAMPTHGIVRISLERGLVVVEEEISGFEDTVSWARARRGELLNPEILEGFERQTADNMSFLCMTFEYEGSRVSLFGVYMRPFYSNLREISDLTLESARNLLSHRAAIHLGVDVVGFQPGNG